MITATPPYDNASLGVPGQKITSNFICHGYSLHHGMAQYIYIYTHTHNTEVKRIALKSQGANG